MYFEGGQDLVQIKRNFGNLFFLCMVMTSNPNINKIFNFKFVDPRSKLELLQDDQKGLYRCFVIPWLYQDQQSALIIADLENVLDFIHIVTH